MGWLRDNIGHWKQSSSATSKNWYLGLESYQLSYLTLRTAVKEYLSFSAAELTYGFPICLTGEFFSSPSTVSHPDFVHKLQAIMRYNKSIPTSTHGRKTIFISSQLTDQLLSCVHSQRLCYFFSAASILGPIFCQETYYKYFDSDVNGAVKRIFIDILKPYFLLKNEMVTSEPLVTTIEPPLVIWSDN